VLDAAAVGAGTRVLDVGCGSGLALVLAARRAAAPSGQDISPGLLGIARERLPDADLREGDMETLPFGSLSAPGSLEAALAAAALSVVDSGEVVCHWRYASMDDAIRALLCSAGGARAREAAGEPAVREVLDGALAQFRDPQTGVVTMKNTFRLVAARR
jgi:SAM-dependent methyltransferase